MLIMCNMQLGSKPKQVSGGYVQQGSKPGQV